MIPETTQKTLGAELVGQVFPMRRPRTLAACARIGARRYRGNATCREPCAGCWPATSPTSCPG